MEPLIADASFWLSVQHCNDTTDFSPRSWGDGGAGFHHLAVSLMCKVLETPSGRRQVASVGWACAGAVQGSPPPACVCAGACVSMCEHMCEHVCTCVSTGVSTCVHVRTARWEPVCRWPVTAAWADWGLHPRSWTGASLLG